MYLHSFYTGILVFVLDTGIRWGHEEFMNDPNTRSRVICGFDAFNWYDKPGDWNNGCYDGVGHGTHVAAIIGGSYYVGSNHSNSLCHGNILNLSDFF